MNDTLKTTKVQTGVIGLTTLVAGFVGGQVADNSTIDSLNTQIDAIKVEKQQSIDDKQTILKQYIYSQKTSGRPVSIDLTHITQDEIVNGYISILKDAGIDASKSPNIQDEIYKLALKKGDVLKCQ